jgi:phosphoglycolate phosphatase
MSNNDAFAIHSYLQRHELTAYVRDVIGRPFMRPDLMKPHPHTVERALAVVASRAPDTVLIGDSVTDIQVARATGVHSVGYAKTRRRGDELRAAGADALTEDIADLAGRLRRC